MSKIIKEIIIALLVCLIVMLIFAIVLYDYIPSKKVVAEVSTYTTSEEIETQLADDIDSEEKEVVLTYEVTSKDLSSYEVTNEYVPGKANPFSEIPETVDNEIIDDNTTNSIDNTIDNTVIEKPLPENETETNSYIDDGGLK